MIRRAMALLAAGSLAAPALAGGQAMAGTAMAQSQPQPQPEKPAPAAPAPQPMPGMDMSGSHADHDAVPPPSDQSAPIGTDQPAGKGAAPPPPGDNYADRTYPADQMAHARMAMMDEEGGASAYQLLFNLAELQVQDGHAGYRWDGEGWFGGDINRFTVKSEGEGTAADGVEEAEIQALYSRAIGPTFNLQAGIRHDFQPTPDSTYATLGFEGLAPYQFEVEGAVFLSTRGDLLGRLEGYYDEQITQRLVLQPRVELNFAAQNVPENKLGAGLTDAELGLRLRYELQRGFAPYVGVSWERKTGDTARLARADGEDAGGPALVVGIRTAF